ncbi:DUF4012 domain-containing protein [Luteimicrobium sp. NPDC057192]|uniref:DUF4012 domain-containing protein n=1 Tax=Luteimicrobium sp. NPDC057192 TaxID=3346042 RepID=UPI00363767F7
MTHPGWGQEWDIGPVAAPPRPRPAARRRTLPPERGGDGPRHHRRTLRRLALVALAVVAVLAALAAWLVVDAVRAQHALEAARADVATLERQVRAGDDEAASRTLRGLAADTARARSAAHGPVWSLAAELPYVGRNTRAVQTVAQTADDLALRTLPGLVDAVAVVDPEALAPDDATVALGPVERVASRVVASDAAARSALQQLDAVDHAGLVGPVRDAVTSFRMEVAGVVATTATAAKVADLLPTMLGADGPRDYLVLVQNNAEQRATGGIPGSVLLVRADQGRVEVLEQKPGTAISTRRPVLPLGDAERALFGTRLATDMRDVTFTPDFPRTAQLAKALWEKREGGTVDGVVSVDPVALGLLLGATGDVVVDGTTLSGRDAATYLLNGVYLDRPEPAAQDAFFVDAARAVFSGLSSGEGDPRKAVASLAEAARAGRLMLWSTHEDEEDQLAPTVLSGRLEGSRTSRSGTSPVVGIYLEDGTQAKLGYYLDLDLDGRATVCRADGSQAVELTVTLSSRAPSAAAELPGYLVGVSDVVPAGETRTNVLVYAPTGGGIASSRASAGTPGLFAQVHDGLSVGARTVTLEPGGKATLRLTIDTGPGQSGDVVVRSTPTARQGGSTVVPSSCG